MVARQQGQGICGIVILSFDRERSLPALHDIDIVGLRMVVNLAARAAGNETIEMHVDILGAQS